MTILIVLLGLLISHQFVSVGRIRRYDPLLKPLHWARRRYSRPPWVPMLVVLVTAILAALLLSGLASVLMGAFGWFVVALLIVVYSLGPRDLDRDVEVLLAGGNDPRHFKIRRIMRLGADAGAEAGAASVFRAAQARWFGILFWFVLLGIPGALLYRLARVSLHEPGLQPAQSEWLLRLRSVLDWPVLALLTLGIALAGDFDRIRQAWRHHQAGGSGWRLGEELLADLATTTAQPGDAFEDGIRRGHEVVWRVLWIWLVVLSLLLILGWLV